MPAGNRRHALEMHLARAQITINGYRSLLAGGRHTGLTNRNTSAAFTVMPLTLIRRIEYDPDSRILSVWFVPRDKLYEFEDVPPERSSPRCDRPSPRAATSTVTSATGSGIAEAIPNDGDCLFLPIVHGPAVPHHLPEIPHVDRLPTDRKQVKIIGFVLKRVAIAPAGDQWA